MTERRILRIRKRIIEIVSGILMGRDLFEGNEIITILDVDVAKNLSKAQVFVGVISQESNEIDIVHKLNSFSWLFNKEIASALKLRKTPKVEFLLGILEAKGSNRVLG